METLITLPAWALALMIFSLRVVDVSLGTMRTLMVVQGRVPYAVAMGFVEVLLWTTAISQVITNIGQYPLLAVAYAGGFATGNAVGITLERFLAFGTSAARIITSKGASVAARISTMAHVVTSITGSGSNGQVTLLYVTCERRILRDMITQAQAIDPHLFYVIERFSETSRLAPILQPTGWRAVLKKK